MFSGAYNRGIATGGLRAIWLSVPSTTPSVMPTIMRITSAITPIAMRIVRFFRHRSLRLMKWSSWPSSSHAIAEDYAELKRTGRLC